MNQTTKRRIHTVSQLTSVIKDMLEDAFAFVWVTGEISNFSVPASGHFYFTLKDSSAQLQAVMFKGHAKNLKFTPANGMSVICLGRISVYEPQGTYQILVEHIDPSGMGALAMAFEQLKERLDNEGLFDSRHKKKLPFLPEKICVITSPTGAVIHDILRVISYRFPKIYVQVWPVKVQGHDANMQIVQALMNINSRQTADVIILARGGGSLEDFSAFNSEEVARAIFASEIPVVSAIGHETDFCISDFVADLRAPTPSAAIEMIIPEAEALDVWRQDMFLRLKRSFSLTIQRHRDRLDNLAQNLPGPQRQIEHWRLRLDDYNARVCRMFTGLIQEYRQILSTARLRLNPLILLVQQRKDKETLELIYARLIANINVAMTHRQATLNQARARLGALNPRSILKRGYSITQALPEKNIIRKANQVNTGQDIEVILALGKLICVVKDVKKGED